MKSKRTSRARVLRAAALLVLASPVSAGVLTVDPSGAGDFLDIQSAVAAAAVAVVALVTVGPLAGDDPRPVAAADLQPFGDADVDAVEGDFVLADGSARLRLDLSSLPAAEDAFYEVWLLDAEQGRLVSLGPVRDDNTYALPAGTPVDAFPLVDVSVEPLDGDPTHSGDSVLRGPVQVTT